MRGNNGSIKAYIVDINIRWIRGEAPQLDDLQPVVRNIYVMLVYIEFNKFFLVSKFQPRNGKVKFYENVME